MPALEHIRLLINTIVNEIIRVKSQQFLFSSDYLNHSKACDMIAV